MRMLLIILCTVPLPIWSVHRHIIHRSMCCSFIFIHYIYSLFIIFMFIYYVGSFVLALFNLIRPSKINVLKIEVNMHSKVNASFNLSHPHVCVHSPVL